MTAPTPYQRRFCTANGIVQSYLEAGASDHPAVVLIHGLGWDAERLWSSSIDGLVRAGRRVIAPDLRGVGQSAVLDQPHTIARYADDVGALLDEAGVGGYALVGFSMGGMIAVDLAGRLPERVLGLALCCSGLQSTPDDASAVEVMLARAADLGPQRFAAEQAEAIWHRGWADAHPEAVADFKQWRAAMDPVALAHAFRAPSGLDLRAAFARLDLPIEVIAARDDAFLAPATARAVVALNAGANLRFLDDCGHMAPIERPAEFAAAILRFLDRVPVAARYEPETSA
ncbi:MAG: alpha/beta hydrolase [Ancalomicrobiaceae bacterium]|nr:alpha/beta hydrolase [Ancalomicrobiaceae bacterium]